MAKILVIEDEELIREGILELLDAEEFTAMGAENGRVGLSLAQEHLPDLILCDVMMPELDGYGVLNALRKNRQTANIPFIFLSGKTDRSDLRQGMELGADDYITKPCTPAELLKAIAIRLEKHSAVRERYTTEIKQELDRLNNLVNYDPITKLPNRLSLREQFNEILREWRSENQDSENQFSIPHSHSPPIVPVLCLGLDQFNRLNNTLGYEFGDLLLIAVANQLTTHLGNRGTVARLYADQFAIILDPIDNTEKVMNFAQALLDNFSHPFLLDKRQVFITASIGIALYPNDGQEIEKLLLHANKGMNRVKQIGGNQYEFYTPTLSMGGSDLLALETDLRYALERDEFELDYQPQVSLKTGQIVGGEALLRWNHTELGRISPATFIPLAEETGLIVPIGEWVLFAACQQTHAWHAAGCKSFRIAVNLSGRQFSQPNLCQRLGEILTETRLDPNCLDLELTESILVQNSEVAIRRLKALKALGMQIAIDDFGTGYSSLSYLQQFPFDILKIDQCFVREIARDAKNTAITKAIIEMAHNLSLKLIAEGVETEAELDFLCEYKCDEMQGYLFSRPLPVEEFEKLLFGGKKLLINKG